jgi:broad specificity phosphatase PhoE
VTGPNAGGPDAGVSGPDAGGPDASGPDASGPSTAGPRLILVRHGQTDSNVAKALDSRPPGAPLNATGHAQAEDTAAKLAAEPVAAVYASTAIRAQQTAAAIAARQGLVVEVVPHVHEIDCGDLEGRADHAARALFEDVYASWVAGELTRRLPGGESAADLIVRFADQVGRLWRRHAERSDQAFILVSHGAAIRIGAGALLGEGAETDYVPNAGRVVLTPTADAPAAGGWRLEFWEQGAPPEGDVTGGAQE